MHNYLELKIWQRSRGFVKSIYRLTDFIPGNQEYGLTGQMQRAAISVPSNVTAGAGRNSSKEFMRFPVVANVSGYEPETQLFLSTHRGYVKLKKSKQLFQN